MKDDTSPDDTLTRGLPALPEIGSWFRNLSGGHTFEVVAIDEHDQTIEIQHYDGTVEEVELEAWKELELESVDAPEDWSGSLDVDDEDLHDDDETRQDWDDPLDYMDEQD